MSIDNELEISAYEEKLKNDSKKHKIEATISCFFVLIIFVAWLSFIYFLARLF